MWPAIIENYIFFFLFLRHKKGVQFCSRYMILRINFQFLLICYKTHKPGNPGQIHGLGLQLFHAIVVLYLDSFMVPLVKKLPSPLSSAYLNFSSILTRAVVSVTYFSLKRFYTSEMYCISVHVGFISSRLDGLPSRHLSTDIF